MYQVISRFRDKYNPNRIYEIGDTFESNDKKRIKDLINRKLIAKADKESSNSEKPDSGENE